ncbi:inorganic phosphate transporter [Methanocella sp. CWC-04]|uniref:Inorganic phosphate transporter n=1 Tax=Methanooceanicella nereidis TaxID=2052831 RepID=A0AAP2RD64_9EURY|nr:inorganic phosphate transporter [Methanocella sp. CWC-04]MCD1294485.1 inorganic phosphate transporter [Methanocella sp. CWC-04]
MDPFILMVIAILVALAFDMMNGFHDTANSVATVIYTKALPPQVAISIAALMNMIGPFLLGTAVAKVIATSIIPSEFLTIEMVMAGLMGAILWDLLTWWYGLPVSSSHALIGGLVGSGLAAIGFAGVKWSGLTKVILALLVSPVVGVVLGLVFMLIIGRYVISRMDKQKSNSIFKKIQILSSAAVSLSHGSNDAQKTMGIIAMFVAVTYGHSEPIIETWMIIACALAIGLGTAMGGWRIIRTLGERIGKEELSPSQGFAAETATALTIAVGSHIGAPISTTHVLSSSVVGTVMSGGTGVLNKKVVLNILMAWVLTIPVAAIAAALSYYVLMLVGI